MSVNEWFIYLLEKNVVKREIDKNSYHARWKRLILRSSGVRVIDLADYMTSVLPANPFF